MLIIAFGDIHMAASACRKIPGVHQADLVLLTGDLTNFGSLPEVRQVLDEVMAVNSRVLAQFGNLDRPEVNDYLDDLGINMHGQGRLIQDRLCVVGIGGSNPTPFATPSEFSEEQLLAVGAEAYRKGLDAVAGMERGCDSEVPVLLVSHAPPVNTRVDRIYTGRHVGSAAIRRIIETHQPDLCITGHIHEARGADTIGPTTVLNPGTLRSGGWIEIRLNHSTLHATLQ